MKHFSVKGQLGTNDVYIGRGVEWADAAPFGPRLHLVGRDCTYLAEIAPSWPRMEPNETTLHLVIRDRTSEATRRVLIARGSTSTLTHTTARGQIKMYGAFQGPVGPKDRSQFHEVTLLA